MPSPPANRKRTRSSAARCASRTRSAASSIAWRMSAAGRASRSRPTIARRSSLTEVRYFLDTEYNGWGGLLLSLALVPEDGEELYLTFDWDGALEPWVERNVVPYLDSVPEPLVSPRMSRADAARTIAHYFAGDPDPLIVADWPEDIALFSALLVTGPGVMAEVPHLRFEMIALTGFSTAANSKVPHNALHDARSLRDHILSLE